MSYGSYGIQAVAAATVTNSGTISATSSAEAAYGIFGSTTASVTNSGKISASGAGGGVIISIGTSTVNNSGTILADGTTCGCVGGGIVGIYGLTTAIVTNSGNIYVSDTSDHAYGVNGSNTNVTNSGVISAVSISGTATGILGGAGNNTLTNTGTISATTTSGTAYAIQFGSNVDTVTLGAGSKIIGTLDLGGGADVVNFTGGNSNLTFTSGNLTSAVFTGSSIPYAVSGDRAASVDPTSFASSVNMLQSTTRALSSIVPDFGSTGSEQKSLPALAYTADPKAPNLSSGV
jgi:hypothetical protein